MESLSRPEHRPRVLPLREVVVESSKVKSFYVNSPEIASSSEPGQFVMIWVIGVDEIPMAVSKAGKDGTLGITVERVGDATSKLHEFEEGDLIGIRGPYGNGFDISGDNLLVVCGGCGTAPLAFAVEEAVEQGKDLTVVLTAETSEDLLFRSRFEELNLDLIVGTEDGTAGVQGITTEVLDEVDLTRDFETCLICGPEKMMVATAEMVERAGIPAQVSIDRYMKCGIGICGQCSIDNSGVRVCEEGPVFDYDEVKDGEFGSYRRDSTGKRVGI